MSASYYLNAVFDNWIPEQWLDGCCMTRPFLSLQRVWLVRPRRLLKLTGSRQYVAEVKISAKTCILVVRMAEKGCRQKWKLDWAKFKRRMLKSTNCRESYKHWGYVLFVYYSVLIQFMTSAELCTIHCWYRQRWMLGVPIFISNSEREMLKSTDCRKNWK